MQLPLDMANSVDFTSRASVERFLNSDAAVQAIVHSPAANFQARRIEPSCMDFFKEISLACQFLFFHAMSTLLKGLCMTDQSKRVWTLSKHAINELSLMQTEKVFRNQLLV